MFTFTCYFASCFVHVPDRDNAKQSAETASDVPLEKKVPFSKATAGQLSLALGLGVLNIFGVFTLGSMLSHAASTSSYLVLLSKVRFHFFIFEMFINF